ncbi:MAG: TPM domain-containing protein [Deltaproteobacteria bacterium]|nr:TPM domain-containing protein [Deltaproteobacteria bacterium]
MRRVLLGTLLAAGMVLAVLFTRPYLAAAADVPALKARVNDYAHLLAPSTVSRLEQALMEFEKSQSTQIVVLTVNSLQGESLEGFSMQVAEAWKVGQKDLDNGAILLIAKKERKVRIEVGYGLEGRLTDMLSGRIIRDVIVPSFKAGNFDQGVANGVAAMMAAVKGEYQAQPQKRLPKGSGSSANFIPLIVFIFLIMQLGRVRRGLGVLAGGLLLPVFGSMILPFGLITLLLVPAGLLAGFVLSLFGSAMGTAGAVGHRRRGGGFWLGGSGGGFSSGGFGGFSGGGGGFGGGGASGGW